MEALHRRWMQQWIAAAKELQEVRDREIRAITESDSVRLFNQLDIPLPAPLRKNSGLVIQQRIFHKGRGSTVERGL